MSAFSSFPDCNSAKRFRVKLGALPVRAVSRARFIAPNVLVAQLDAIKRNARGPVPLHRAPRAARSRSIRRFSMKMLILSEDPVRSTRLDPPDKCTAYSLNERVAGPRGLINAEKRRGEIYLPGCALWPHTDEPHLHGAEFWEATGKKTRRKRRR